MHGFTISNSNNTEWSRVFFCSSSYLYLFPIPFCHCCTNLYLYNIYMFWNDNTVDIHLFWREKKIKIIFGMNMYFQMGTSRAYFAYFHRIFTHTLSIIFVFNKMSLTELVCFQCSIIIYFRDCMNVKMTMFYGREKQQQ